MAITSLQLVLCTIRAATTASTTSMAALQQSIQRAKHRMAQRDVRVGHASNQSSWPTIAEREFVSFYGGAVLGAPPFEVAIIRQRSASAHM